MSARRLVRWAACAAPLAAAALGAQPVRADETPIRVAYTAHGGCPPASVFLAEILARTSRARLAAPRETATVFEVDVEQFAGDHVGRLRIRSAAGRSTREIDGSTCDEVVSGLALIAALTIDPHASTAPQPIPTPSVGPPLPQPPASTTPTPVPPKPAGSGAPAQRRAGTAPPLPGGTLGSTAAARRWTTGLDGLVAAGVAPYALLGAGPFVQVRAESPLGWALRLSASYATTGEFNAGPSRAVFVWSVGRLDGCPMTVRPVSRVLLLPCVTAEGGVLRARGLDSRTIGNAREVKLPWFALGSGLRVELEAMRDRVVFAAHGGLAFPFVREQFVFANPEIMIHAVPTVTGTFGLGVGIQLP